MHNDSVLKIDLAIKDNILKTYTFTKDTVDIGRIPSADIFIDNSGISRQHTRIERTIGGPYIVKDMGSTNGTFLNDMQINEAALNSEDVIGLGKFSLRVTIESGEQPKSSNSEISKDDFDGTTVLSADQLARLRAGLEEDKPGGAVKTPAAGAVKSGAASEGSGISLTQVLLWGGLAVVLVIIVVLLLK